MSIEVTKKPIELFFANEPHSLQRKNTVLALGTFDGVHIAHKELLLTAKALKKRIGADLVGAWCFEESPAAILKSEKQVLITNKTEKISLLLASGLDFVAMGHFPDFKDVSAEDFMRDILKERLGCIGTVAGYDHRFGSMGRGNAEMLKEFFGGLNSVTIPEIKLDGETVGSSAIRKHLLMGEIEKANAMLGRKFSIKAPVTEGKKLGRRLGFPTANQQFPDNVAPICRGVYATLCSFGTDEQFIGITNVGVRPSIAKGDDHALNCETYIVDFEGDVYGKDMTVRFCKYLRNETRFSSLDELTQAIKNDRESALRFFSQNNN